MDIYDLDFPILQFPFSAHEQSTWTIRHAVEGVQIFGGIGSGKTSGSGRMLALKYLKAGFSGLVLTAKPDEKETWQNYCAETNRTNDLVIIEPNGKYNFNFLEYESTHTNSNEAITENIVQVLKTVIRAGEEKDSGKGDDPFWESALDMLIFNVIDLCKIAYGSVSVQMMYDIVQTLPKATDQTNNQEDEQEKSKAFNKAYQSAHNKVLEKVRAWDKSLTAQQQSLFAEPDTYHQAVLDNVIEARLMKFLHEFFFDNFKNLSSKTRSIIEFTFSGFLFRLLREPVYSMFCRNKSNITPDDCLNGKIIIINLPVKVYHKVGRDCQILFKYIWQRAMEKRNIKLNRRPLFLWADEAQNFLHEHDAEYQATARSSRISTVYISQNLPNYYASMGGQKAEYRVKSFLGTLGTKIFHANADIETNKYASELIGDTTFFEPSRTITTAKDFSQSDSLSLKIDRHVRPEKFISLRTGGEKNNYRVEGYFHRQGDSFAGKKNFIKIDFDQLFRP
ncbi:TraM recognition domain-containing protein [Arcicella aquatica]|uniref:TraM recognition domain-containing protein n=1 Tax=Arcicella aquatica TaxID=217141 RepID=A0ABU5QU16_9BACT|nr:TraM recognition domain-containing protein [Arcicella aquatica]MEA5260309.1 TraM recognition domain-containing protein [Arcicella aquatica]